MASTFTLSGDIADLGLNDFQIGPGNARKIKGYVRTNLGAGDALEDQTTGLTLLGDTPVTIASDGTWSVELIDTAATDLNVEANTLQYELVVEYTSTGSPAKRVYRSGWFALTANTAFTALDKDLPSVTPSWRSAFAAEMEAIRDETAVISGLTGEDAAVALLIDTPASDTAAALSATIVREGGIPTATAPTSPDVGQVWLSSSLRDARVSPHPADRPVVLSPLSGEGDVVQEPITWADATHINMLYTGGSGLRLRQCPINADPLVAANWTRFGSTYVIGGGVAGVAGTVAHASLYREGSTLHVFGKVAADNTIRRWTADVSAPTVWTLAGTVLPSASMPAGATVWGNTYVVKDTDGVYVMFMEYKDSAGVWQMGQATCATVGGTYAFTVNKMTTHYGYGGAWQGGGGAFVTRENGEWVLWFHGMPGVNSAGVVPTEGFRATAPSLRADNWTPLDNGHPHVRRVSRYEVDQVADLDVVTLPSGVRYAFWAANDNRAPMQGRILGAKLTPARRQWNGAAWVTLDAIPDPLSRGSADPALPAVRMLASDKTITATGATEVMAIKYTPQTRDYEVEWTMSARLNGAATDEYLFEVINDYTGSRITYMGAVGGNGGNLVNLHFKAKIIQQTVGLASQVSVRIICPTGGQFQCRPITAPTKEQMSMTITPIQNNSVAVPTYL